MLAYARVRAAAATTSHGGRQQVHRARDLHEGGLQRARGTADEPRRDVAAQTVSSTDAAHGRATRRDDVHRHA
eukprot:2773380-Lingulodinium_polyedra.AAC.1